MHISAYSGAGTSQAMAQMTKLLSQFTSTQTTSAATTPSSSATSSASAIFTELESFFQNRLSSDTMGGLLQAQGGPPPGPPSGPPPGNGQMQSAGGAGGFTPPSLSDIDSDGDGSLTQAEMEAYGSSVHGDTDTARADDLFSRMDADGDGAVTSDEKTSFDAQMTAQGPRGHAEPASTNENSSETLADLMQQLLTALQSYSSTATTTATAATTTTSVAA